jgi:hypothetical protein
MGIVYPSKAVAARWNGALQARLRRAPLEMFLRGRSLIPAPAGASQDNDNLVRATIVIVEAGLTLHLRDHEEGLTVAHRPVVGHVASLVSLALAQQISEPDVWRNVALVSTGRLLAPSMGLSQAAPVAASAVRQFQQEIMSGASPSDWRIMNSACEAVSCNDGAAFGNAASTIAARLSVPAPVTQAVDLPAKRPGHCLARELPDKRPRLASPKSSQLLD